MPKNVVDVYRDADALRQRFGKELDRYSGGLALKAVIGGPVVMRDDMSREWLEINYLFATDFRPGRRPAVGSIGADVREVPEIDGRMYLSVLAPLIFGASGTLNSFRSCEEEYAEWKECRQDYRALIGRLRKAATLISRQHPDSKQLKQLASTIREESAGGIIGFRYNSGLPTQRFVNSLSAFMEALPDGDAASDEVRGVATRLHAELPKHSALLRKLRRIRSQHGGIPYISGGMVRIDAPVASGGVSIFTRPGYGNPYDILPFRNGLLLALADNKKTKFFSAHYGGGKAGEGYCAMHIPRKHFFREVQQAVDDRWVRDKRRVAEIKREVLGRRMDAIMQDEILGFSADARSVNDAVVFAPIVAEREYERHAKELGAMGQAKRDFGAVGTLIDIGDGYMHYDDAIECELMVA
ncbi:hypothetical protein HY501_01030 [Candidatus Woesearchaeota archaeon]|nr:hypothetical protein [Candidatus Woesearchaeota archaeon]